MSCNETYSVSVTSGHLKTGVTENGMLVGGGVETELIVHYSVIESSFEWRSDTKP